MTKEFPNAQLILQLRQQARRFENGGSNGLALLMESAANAIEGTPQTAFGRMIGQWERTSLKMPALLAKEGVPSSLVGQVMADAEASIAAALRDAEARTSTALHLAQRLNVEASKAAFGDREPINGSHCLLSLQECQKATKADPQLQASWGWVASASCSRNSSILSLFKVSGEREGRRVVPVMVNEYEGSIDPASFGDVIHGMLDPELYPSVAIVLSDDGLNADTAAVLESHGRQVTRVRWSQHMHSNEDRKRFFNLRAFTYIQAKIAIQQGRMLLDESPKTAEQFSNQAPMLTEEGAWKMMSKKQMKDELGVSATPRSDTYCLAMLANYVPANEVESHQEHTAANQQAIGGEREPREA